jgi:hypothetical protein
MTVSIDISLLNGNLDYVDEFELEEIIEDKILDLKLSDYFITNLGHTLNVLIYDLSDLKLEKLEAFFLHECIDFNLTK